VELDDLVHVGHRRQFEVYLAIVNDRRFRLGGNLLGLRLRDDIDYFGIIRSFRVYVFFE